MVEERVLVPNSPSARPEQFPQAPKTLNTSGADLPAASGNPDVPNGPTEIVVRPTGLRHGRWEAPAWAFWTIGATVVVLAALYALFRLGYLRKRAQ